MEYIFSTFGLKRKFLGDEPNKGERVEIHIIDYKTPSETLSFRLGKFLRRTKLQGPPTSPLPEVH